MNQNIFMAVFEIGDLVEGIDDTVRGIVREVDNEKITVESDEGFLLEFAPQELIMVPESSEIRVSRRQVTEAKNEKELPKKRKQPISKPKERNAPKLEVDLHIGQLVQSSKGMTNHEMLNVQLETAKRQLEFAIRKRIQKVVFIHGVGEGVLREELYYLFRRYENITYYDADYQKYGLGATEIYIYQNP
ncbi:Smr/MutS family protein [Maribacter halichondriae]|uniref:Smr/MutS family protein n=1 Tax=Maribacter halichondriae TaxID=2980554 RepID=UPI0023589074|nr:Smr/MutS family protein [Maribacter sp. Hal144]